jgi:aspartate aminotransferase-like enzyme
LIKYFKKGFYLKLFTPGPTPVPESIRQSMALPTIHHRTLEFETIFKEARELLKEFLNCHEVLLLASSGTGAMESAVTNLTKKTLVTVNGGKFGERFSKIAKSHNINYHELKYDYDTPANIDEVVNLVKKSQADTLAIQISESSGGVRHPVEEIAKKIKEFNSEIMVIADGITAIGVEKIDTQNIDALIGGSQKAFMLPPALSIIGLSKYGVEHIQKSGGYGFYFNLNNELKKQKQNTTAYTPATTLIIGLVEILKEFKAYGFENLFKDTKQRAELSREALKSIGLKIYPKKPALAMTTIYHEKSPEIRKILKNQFGVHVAGGQEHIKNLIFRVNHMGLIANSDMAWVLNSIEMALHKLNIRKYNGTANKIFSEGIL